MTNHTDFNSTELLGRFLNSQGQAIDGKGQPAPIPAIPPLASTQYVLPSGSLFVTGIKIIDLLAPFSVGSIVGLLGSTNASDDLARLQQEHVLERLESQIILSREMAQQGLWPAVDRQRSTSRLLQSGTVVSTDHRELAQQVRDLLAQFANTQTTQNTGQDAQIIKRVQQLQKFLTQPYFVAEAYTDVPGEYVPLEKTLEDCRAILEGRYDNMPVEAFYFVGTVEQALAKAKGQ